MANLAASAVSVYPSAGISAGQNRRGWWYPSSDRHIMARSLLLVLTGQGTLTNQITAAALGFTVIYGCGNLYDATNTKVYLATVDPIDNIILLSAIAADAPADITTTAAYITVWGTIGSLGS